MIGRCIVKGKSQERFERSPVVDLSFQFRVGIDLEPLLKKKALHKDKRRIGVVSFKAFTDGIFSHEEAFNSGPVDSGVDLFHSFNSPVLFHGSKERYIGEGEVGFHFFEAHSSSKKFYLKELCLKRNWLPGVQASLIIIIPGVIIKTYFINTGIGLLLIGVGLCLAAWFYGIYNLCKTGFLKRSNTLNVQTP
jgi:hypothetical protein